MGCESEAIALVKTERSAVRAAYEARLAGYLAGTPLRVGPGEREIPEAPGPP